MPQPLTTVDLENIRTFLSRLSPAGFEDQTILVNLVHKLDEHIAKGKAHGNSRSGKTRAAA